MFSIEDRVTIGSSSAYGNRYESKTGVVKSVYKNARIGVAIDGVAPNNCDTGLYWFTLECLKKCAPIGKCAPTGKPTSKDVIPGIRMLHYNPDMQITTIVWSSGNHTSVRLSPYDVNDAEKAVAMCVFKHTCAQLGMSAGKTMELLLDTMYIGKKKHKGGGHNG